MNAQEIINATQGAKVNNIPVSEIKELIGTVCKRMTIPHRKCPSGDVLDYMANQIYYRGNYTPAELMLAVDYYNAGLLSYKINEFDSFGLVQLNAMMSAYKDIKYRFVERDGSESKPESFDHKDQNRAAIQKLTRQIYDGYKSGQPHEVRVMYLWLCVYRYLLEQGEVSAERFDAVKDRGDKMFRAAMLQNSLGGTIAGMIKVNESVECYQAFIVVNEYMKLKTKPK